MCGRFTLSASPRSIIEHFDITGEHDVSILTPRFNIAPSQEVAAVFKPDSDSARGLQFMRWGLVPHWASDIKIGYKMINARTETLSEKPAYRTLFKRHRCLIPADGYYEWKQSQGRKQPYYIHYPDCDVFGFAALWDHWKGDKDEILSCTIITTEADSKLGEIHNRMPVILSSEHYNRWLDPELQDTDILSPMLVTDTSSLEAYPVSTMVNNPKNLGAGLIVKQVE